VSDIRTCGKLFNNCNENLMAFKGLNMCRDLVGHVYSRPCDLRETWIIELVKDALSKEVSAIKIMEEWA